MELKEKVRVLVKEVDKTHRYSMSNIYGLYNEVFDKKETPQSCASCLIRKINELKKWLTKEDELASIKEMLQDRTNLTPVDTENIDLEGAVSKSKKKRKEV